MSKLKLENEGTSNYLVFELEPSDEIDNTTLGMMTNNTFNGILPIIYTQVDQIRFFKFNIGSKIPLERYLSGGMNRQKVLMLCSSIMDTISEAEEYMIENSNFIINPKCIFVEEVSGRAYLVCLPLEGLANADILDFFKRVLFYSGISYDSTDTTGYLITIMNYLNAPSASLAGFHEMIDTMIGKKKRVAAPQLTSQFELKKNALPPIKPRPVPAGPTAEPEGISVSENLDKRVEPERPVTISPKPDKEIEGFDIPGGGSIPDFENEIEEKPQKKSRTLFGIPLTRADIDTSKQKTKKKEQKAQRVPRTLFGIPLTRADIQKTKEKEFEEDNVSYPDQEINNVPDFEESYDMYDESLEPRLVRDDGITSVSITSDRFIIGRREDMCDYAIPNKKISKRHACIEREGNRFRVIDLNSTNHTYVEGEIVDSNGAYIEHGTRIAFAEEEFIFELQ